jgi:LacI family transcriptional regulator
MEAVNCNKVINNNYEAVFDATTKMLNSGRKNIALVNTIKNITVGQKRINGFIDAMNEKLGPDCKKHIIHSENKAVREDMIEFIKDNPQIDGIIALDVFSSYAALKATRYNNKNVPKDVAVIGYIAERIADNLNPELTTINQHGTKTGTTIANLIIGKLEAKPEDRTIAEEVLISSTLTHRLTF